MAEALYTVKDLARMCAPTKGAEAIKRTMRQIRHWTNKDILRPLGQKNTGIGVSRVYDAHGARKAAILVEIARYGVTVDMLRGFSEWCDKVANHKTWLLAIAGEGPASIGVTWNPGRPGKGRWSLYSEDEYFMMSVGAETDLEDPHFLDCPSSILINIDQIFKRVRQ